MHWQITLPGSTGGGNFFSFAQPTVFIVENVKPRQAKVAVCEIRTEFESSVLSLAVAEDSSRQVNLLVGLNSGEVEEWAMGNDDARAIRSRDSVTEGLWVA